MLNKSQMKIISVVLAVVLLVVAFMTGAMGIMDDLNTVKKAKTDFSDFDKMLVSMAEYDKSVTEGKAEYDTRRAQLDSDTLMYEEELASYTAEQQQFSEDVMTYNTKLLEYNAGKDAMSAGESAFTEGKKQLEDGWAAYNAGRDAFEQGKAEAQEQLEQYYAGKEAYEAGLEQYESGLAAYNQLLDGIAQLESRYVPHWLALTIISAQAGQKITDDSIAEMKSQLDSAKTQLDEAKAQLDAADSMLPDAEKQMQDAEKQLDDTKKLLEDGQAELDKAQEQYEAGKAQIEGIGSSLSGTQEELDERSAELEDKAAKLETRKEALDAEAKELSVYEDTQEKLSRRRDALIDEGFGTDSDSNETLMNAAAEERDSLHGTYIKTIVSFIVTYSAHMLSIAAAVTALALLKKHFLGAKRTAAVGLALGLISVIASIVLGSLDTLAFASAVFALAGVGLTEKETA